MDSLPAVKTLSCLLVGAGFFGLRADTFIVGHVTNNNNAPVAGARIALKNQNGALVETVSDQAGAFTCPAPADTGTYRVLAERSGYFRLDEEVPVRFEAGRQVLEIVLTPLREVYESIDVRASSQSVNLEAVTPTRTLYAAEILAIPFPSSDNLKNALRVVPGIVQDAKAGIHVNGGAEEQVLFTLNGFTLNDPLTGRFDSRVGVEPVQSVDVANGRLPAEFGKGAAGMVAVTTRSGDDRFRPSITNFFPGVETGKGVFIGNWSPRGGVSGPIRKGRAWFSETAAIQYDQQVLPDLPNGSDRLHAWRVNNLLHTQLSLAPSHILHTGLLFNGWWAPRNGLNALTPIETTLDKQSRQWFFYIKDQRHVWGGALLEFGYSANRSYARESPQGREILRVTPDGYSGNSNIDGMRRAARDQWLASIAFPEFRRGGAHRVKAGVDVSRLDYWQDVRRGGLEYYRNGRRETSVVFVGPSQLSQPNVEASLFVQDSWSLRKDVLLELGTRSDWDRVLGGRNVSPRAGVAWVPRGLDRTKFHAAFATVYETANLRLFTRPLEQYSMTTYFAPGGAPVRGPAARVFTIGPGRLSMPRSRNWSAGVERQVTQNTSLVVNYLRRRGDRGFTYINQLGPSQPPPAEMAERFAAPSFDAIYRLGNDRRDKYDSLEVTVRQTLRRQYGWLGSYTRSRAVSNAVLDIDISDPTTVLRNAGPLPWDSPHRFVGWAYLPLFWKDWAVASLVETRTGFPYSIQGSGLTISDVNTRRFPFFFEWNLHLERRLVLRSHRWEFRAGLNNLTGRNNPNVVNANVDSRNFLQCYGGQRRAFNFRIRWLGRAKS